MKIGLYFGSFNPVHVGHLVIANYMIEYTDIEQLWFVISPHNPLKPQQGLLAEYHRRTLMDLAIERESRFRTCDDEFAMPKPSYTVDTLALLEKKHPAHSFVIIMGSDGLPAFNQWKDYQLIEENYQRFVYPRLGYPVNPLDYKNLVVVDAPLLEISSTFIREAIKNRKNIQFLLPEKVYDFIEEMHFYSK